MKISREMKEKLKEKYQISKSVEEEEIEEREISIQYHEEKMSGKPWRWRAIWNLCEKFLSRKLKAKEMKAKAKYVAESASKRRRRSASWLTKALEEEEEMKCENEISSKKENLESAWRETCTNVPREGVEKLMAAWRKLHGSSFWRKCEEGQPHLQLSEEKRKHLFRNCLKRSWRSYRERRRRGLEKWKPEEKACEKPVSCPQ